MNVLGLHASGPNTASCLLMDGSLVAYAEEERFTRVKLASDAVPTRSAGYCLKEGRLTLERIDRLAIGWDMSKYPTHMAEFYSRQMNHPAKDEYSRLYENISLSTKNPAYFEKRLQIAFHRAGMQGSFPPIHYHQHHRAHAYSVYYLSPFDRALVIVVDGSGEEMATSIWVGEGDRLTLVRSYNLPHSIGYFYAAMTEYLGFSVFTGEGKVMGLAPYGKSNPEIREKLQKVIWLEGDGYAVNPEYIYFAQRSSSLRHTDKLVSLLGQPARHPESEVSPWHADVAWETQNKLEELVAHLAHQAVHEFSIRDVCLAGGVAMNCKMNGVIARTPGVDRCFVFPASNDAGAALGCALIDSADVGNLREKVGRFTPYLGPEYSDEYVGKLLEELKIPGRRITVDTDLMDYVAGLLGRGDIVGWFQGRMEIGPRALGNRSILANPALPGMKDRINAEVKHRESFRPFAPSILVEHAGDCFVLGPRQAYEPYHGWMLSAVEAQPALRAKCPAVVHVDGTIRPQVVSKHSNRKLHGLLSAFHRLTGCPVLLNTSFNVRGEPIVCKPEDAIRCFYSTGLDALVMGSFVLEKTKGRQPRDGR